ncbi:hypothetical protein BH20ACI2_BH20ACI2_18360 [soil metagenome]
MAPEVVKVLVLQKSKIKSMRRFLFLVIALTCFSATALAQGQSVVDPRTGEILKGLLPQVPQNCATLGDL